MRNTRQGYHKPQHEVFIRCMLRHGDATKAYQTAYPNANKRSARSAGIRLYNQPHIRSCIQPILDQRREEFSREARRQADERLKAERARHRHIRSVIYAIANREIKKNRYFKVNGEMVVMQEDLSHTALINLIELDRKLAEGYDNWPSIERQFAHWTNNTAPKFKSPENQPSDSSTQVVISTNGRKSPEVQLCRKFGNIRRFLTALHFVRNDGLDLRFSKEERCSFRKPTTNCNKFARKPAPGRRYNISGKSVQYDVLTTKKNNLIHTKNQ